MLKSATSIMRPIYSHRKQIKTYYETQFLTNLVLNNEIRKKIQLKIRYKKLLESTQVNPLSIISKS